MLHRSIGIGIYKNIQSSDYTLCVIRYEIWKVFGLSNPHHICYVFMLTFCMKELHRKVLFIVIHFVENKILKLFCQNVGQWIFFSKNMNRPVAWIFDDSSYRISAFYVTSIKSTLIFPLFYISIFQKEIFFKI